MLVLVPVLVVSAVVVFVPDAVEIFNCYSSYFNSKMLLLLHTFN